MFKKEKYFYLNSIQDLDLDYIKKTKAKLSEIVSDSKADRRGESNKMQNKVKLEAERLRREADRLSQALKA